MEICNNCGGEIRGDVCENCYDINDEVKITETWYFKQIIPYYDETTLFVIAFTAILLFFTSKKAIDFVLYYVEQNAQILWIVGSIILSILFIFYHAFTKAEKSVFEKKHMLRFAVLINSVSGISVGFNALEYDVGAWGIFPLINIINSIILLILLRFDFLNEKNVSDKNANIYEISVSGVLTFVIFAVSHFILEHQWFITFSMCLAYATNLNTPLLQIIEKAFKLNFSTRRSADRGHEWASKKSRRSRKLLRRQ